MEKLKQFCRNIKGIEYIIPSLMVLFTNAPRHLPEIEYSGNSWTHNIFRFYESIFWRKDGIRAEISSSYDGRITTHQAHSFEGMIALFETMIRSALQWKLAPIKIWIPKLSSPMGLPMPSPYLFAIAYDTSTDGTLDSKSFSHTSTGTNPLLVVVGDDLWNASAMTYNSASLTRITGSTSDASNAQAWRRIAPSTGSNTVAITSAGSPGCRYFAITYSGVDQTSPIDSFARLTSDTTTPATLNTTVNAANCWLVAFGVGSASSNGCTISGTRTQRQNQVHGTSGSSGISRFACLLSDSNATVATGTQGETWTVGGSGTKAVERGIVFSIAPVVAAGPTNLKTVIGVAKASVKTKAGVAMGSIKSYNGIT